MRTPTRTLLVVTVGAALLICTPGAAVAASKATSCTGALAPGSYGKVVVPAGAACLSEGPVTVRGGLFIESGATFVLGSEENPVDTGTISGGVHATQPGVGADPLHDDQRRRRRPWRVRPVRRPVRHHLERDRGQPHQRRRRRSRATTASGSGSSATTSNGSVNLNNNVLEDPDGNEYVTNTIHGSLNCSGQLAGAAGRRLGGQSRTA